MTQVLFVHGAGEGAYEADRALAESLRAALGRGFELRFPRLPEQDDAYESWRRALARELEALDDASVLVGHSVGGWVLVKGLSESPPAKRFAGLFLVATPYFGEGGWHDGENDLADDFGAQMPEDLPVFLYHSRDDESVPFGHLALYRAQLPGATVLELDGRGHQLGDDLSEVARDIRRLTG